MRIHIVTAGDSVYQLAQRYHVSVARIISDNGLLYPYTLVVGQALIILRPTTTHTVQEGESPYRIALRYGLTVQELYQNNPVLADRTPLYPGQELSISFEGQKIRGLAIMGYAYPFVNHHVLRRAMPFLTYLAVFSYGLRLDGSLVIPDDAELLRYAQLYQAQAVMVLSSIGDDGSFSEQITRVLLSDREFQDRALDSLIAQMLQKGYCGLDSDFEYIPSELADAYLSFLENASARLHAAGLFLHCALAPKHSAQQAGLLYEAHRYHEIGAIADRVLLMTYEWGYT